MSATLLTALQPAPAAEAVSASDFDPGLIITDSEFYNADAMTESQIQRFLQSKGSKLATYRTNMKARSANISDVNRPGHVYCHAVSKASNVLASTMIYRVQSACGISAKVILVTLQKEQALITGNTNPAHVKAHMGYACPDTAPCDTTHFGLDNQLYRAALQFKFYQLPENGYNYQPGKEFVYYTTSKSCGGKTINIRSAATAGLYNYTPYQPNRASLNAYPGLGDKCSSYGNRNFWFLYNAWFGSPTDIRPTDIEVARVGGSDRFDTAAKIASGNYQPETTGTVYVTNGMNFPDAVSAAPAAAAQDAPLLLVLRTSIPKTVKDQIQRLKPDQIVVVGGTGVVSKSVYNQLAKLAPKIRRDAGDDRFGTSREIAKAAFGDSGASTAYIATAAGYADALSASAVAGSMDAPVLLVDGKKKSPDSKTTALLSSLGVTDIVVAGGNGVVSSGMVKSLRNEGFTVVRKGGSDRYATSAALNDGAFTTVETVHVASGKDFPDALSAAALAGRDAAPLYLVQPHCIYKPIIQQIIDLEATDMVVYGGKGAVGTGVAKFANCR